MLREKYRHLKTCFELLDPDVPEVRSLISLTHRQPIVSCLSWAFVSRSPKSPDITVYLGFPFFLSLLSGDSSQHLHSLSEPRPSSQEMGCRNQILSILTTDGMIRNKERDPDG